MQHLDMSAFVVDRCPDAATTTDTDAVYDLYGVVNHHGPLISSGRYTATVPYQEKKGDPSRWANFSDINAAPCPPSSVCTQDAYMLFYVRRTPRPTPGYKGADGGDSSGVAGDVSKRQSDACDVGCDEDGVCGNDTGNAIAEERQRQDMVEGGAGMCSDFDISVDVAGGFNTSWKTSDKGDDGGDDEGWEWE